MRSDELLVGGDDFNPALERRRRDSSRWLVAADSLDNHVNVMCEKRVEVIRKEARVEGQVPIAMYITNEHADEIEADAEARRDRGGGLAGRSEERRVGEGR